MELGSYTVDDRIRSKDAFHSLHAAIAKIAGKEWEEVTPDDVVAWRERVKKNYDGIILYNTAMDAVVRSFKNPYSHFYIVFEPSQIRSVLTPNTFLEKTKYSGVLSDPDPTSGLKNGKDAIPEF